MGLFRKDSVPKTAEEHRKCAEEHRAAAKAMLSTFLKTSIIMTAALIVILATSIAWFVSNTNVRSTSMSIAANNGQRFYLATKKGDSQGVYDNNSSTNSKLQEALKHFQRITNETIQGLPQFQVGTHTVMGSDNIEYIVGDADGISLMVNSTSNVKNTTQNAYVGPGSKGEMTFYIIPTIAGNNQVVNITVSLAAYGLSEPNNGEVTAQLVNKSQLSKILCGHILLFQGKDAQGNYVNQIEPALGEDGTIRFTFTKEDNWVINKPIEITLYWIWPFRFENLVYPGQPDSVFKTSGDAQKGFLDWVNAHKQNIAYTNDSPNNANADMSNSDFAKWSSGYNRGDQLIGDNVAYFIWTISAEE